MTNKEKYPNLFQYAQHTTKERSENARNASRYAAIKRKENSNKLNLLKTAIKKYDYQYCLLLLNSEYPNNKKSNSQIAFIAAIAFSALNGNQMSLNILENAIGNKHINLF